MRKNLTRQQEEYSIVARLIPAATRLVTRAKLEHKNPDGPDVREELKLFAAAAKSIEYSPILISRALSVANGRADFLIANGRTKKVNHD